MVGKTANPFRISSGNSRVYTTFAIELKTLGSSRPSCALSRLSRDSSVARTSRADHVIPLIPFQDGWSTLQAVLACPDCKHDTCFAAELKIFAIPRFYDELGLRVRMVTWRGTDSTLFLEAAKRLMFPPLRWTISSRTADLYRSSLRLMWKVASTRFFAADKTFFLSDDHSSSLKSTTSGLQMRSAPG
jgi:hypothetical protein